MKLDIPCTFKATARTLKSFQNARFIMFAYQWPSTLVEFGYV
jgi:hypothetical protein